MHNLIDRLKLIIINIHNSNKWDIVWQDNLYMLKYNNTDILVWNEQFDILSDKSNKDLKYIVMIMLKEYGYLRIICRYIDFY